MPPRDFSFWAKSLRGQLHSLLPAVIYYHTYFLLTIISHVGGSNEVNTGPMKHWLPASLTTPTLFKSQKILCDDIALGSNLLQCWNPPSQATQFTPILSLLPSLTFYGPSPRAPRGSAIHVFLVLDELFLLIIFT